MGEPLPVVRALRARRRVLGLSARAAAARAGWSPHVPRSWERGDRCPSLERIYTYAAVLGLGKTYATFSSEVSSARKRFFQLWHEHEKPSQVWGADRRVYRRGQAPVVERRLTAHDHLKQRKPRPTATPEPEHGASRYQNGHCRCPICTEAITALRTKQRRARGVKERRIIDRQERDRIYSRRMESVPVKQVAAEFGVSEPLVYKVMSEARQAVPA